MNGSVAERVNIGLAFNFSEQLVDFRGTLARRVA